MEGEQARESEMWKMGGDFQFPEDVKPLTASADSGWNVSSAAGAGVGAGGAVSNREMLFPTSTRTTEMLQHPSHGGLIYGHSASSGWNSMELADSTGLGMPRSAAELSHLMDIGEGFESSYINFTQCLQSGLQMDASEYQNISRTLGVGRGSHHFADYSTNSHHDIPHSSSSPFDFPSPITEAGEHMGDALNVPTTPNSSLSSSSAEGNEEASTKEAAAAAPQADQPPAATADQEEAQDKLSADSKKVSKPRKKGQKRNREPRFAFMTKSDVDHLEDGYRWRKYGQKAVKNSPYPRSYYRCTNAKCSVKKRVERSFEDPTIVITTYEGQHTHQSPALLRGSGGGGVSGGVGGGGGGPALASASDHHILHAHLADQRGSMSMSMNSSGFAPSPFDFPMQMMVQAPPRSNSSLFEHHIQQQGGGIPSPHPALQRSQQQNLTDHGLLQDIFPSGMRKLS